MRDNNKVVPALTELSYLQEKFEDLCFEMSEKSSVTASAARLEQRIKLLGDVVSEETSAADKKRIDNAKSDLKDRLASQSSDSDRKTTIRVRKIEPKRVFYRTLKSL